MLFYLLSTTEPRDSALSLLNASWKVFTVQLQPIVVAITSYWWNHMIWNYLCSSAHTVNLWFFFFNLSFFPSFKHFKVRYGLKVKYQLLFVFIKLKRPMKKAKIVVCTSTFFFYKNSNYRIWIHLYKDLCYIPESPDVCLYSYILNPDS